MRYLTVQAAQQITTDKIREIPIFIVLRNYARWRTEPGRREVSLLDYYYWHCNGDLTMKLPPGFFEPLLQRGLCTVYFDGYDELAGTVMRDEIRKVIENFAINQYPRNRCLLSSRIAGYDRVPLDHKLFTHITLAPFSQGGMESFIRKWYFRKAEEQGLSQRERDEKIKDPETKLKQEQVQLLASNPLLLTMIAIIHRNEARLPEERFRLYEKITEALLQTREQTKIADTIAIGLDRLRFRLANVAQWMHTLSDGKEQRQAEVEKGEIQTKLTEIVQQTEPSGFREDKFKAREEAKRFLEFVNHRAGLLVESGDGLYRFLHLSFQEYFTAYYYNEQDMGISIWKKLYKTHIPKPHYDEVLLLLFAIMVHGGKRKTARAILEHCRVRFWELMGIDSDKITRSMVIEDVIEVGKRLRATGKKMAARFLNFSREALSDCLDLECDEKARIGESFLFMVVYYCRYALFFVKKNKTDSGSKSGL